MTGSGGGPKGNPFSAMPVGSSTALPASVARGGRRWLGLGGLGGGSSLSLLAFVFLLFGSTLLLLRFGPMASHPGSLRGDPNYVDPARIDPSLYSDYTPQLILRGGHEDWVAFEKGSAPHYFTAAELSSLPPTREEALVARREAERSGDKAAVEAAGKAVCAVSEEMPQHCCLGSFSLAGLMAWAGDACLDADFFKFQVPHRSDPGLGMGRYHDMGDVLKRLGNRTLSFLGDSVASQHAHAMECSWLRSGKARTLFYEKEDFHRIFSANGTGFSRAGRYGTNALYTWRTETKVDKEEDGEGVQGTMKLYMTYRPWMNETQALLDSSDTVVVNFGLHYLMEDRKVFEEEMRTLLELARPFASTEGKALVWRENSAQHHLSEGGEFPVTEFPERMGVSKMESLRTGALCHPLRFGARVAPQWRDKIILSLADSLGYRVEFLGAYDGPDGGRRQQEERRRRHHERARRGRGVNATTATEGEGDEGLVASTKGPPPRQRRLDEAVVGADGSLVEEEEEEEEEEGEGMEKGKGGQRRPLLYWMPFFHITAARHDLHPYNPWRKRYDCTHYCYTPLLWDPLVDSLHAAVADRYGGV